MHPVFAIDIKGRVVNADSRQAAEFANVVLRTADSAFVSGTVTDNEGRFSLTKVEQGDYRLVISSVGSETLTIELNGFTKDITLDEILLEEAVQTLDAVTVTASRIRSRIDRKIVVPSPKQIEVSANGVDLLQQMMLPKLRVNALQNTIAVPNGGEVQLRINGVKVEIQDIVALQPADIVRIEFHDNPGLRYNNAEVVLDYIVRRPETGGNVSVTLQDAVNTGWGNNLINARVNHKKSEFAIGYSVHHRDFYEVWRDNEETFHFADGSTIQRKEVGEPGHLQNLWQNLKTAYSYQNDKQMFNAAFRYTIGNTPHLDYRGSIYRVDEPENAFRMTDRTSEKNHRPALDLYYQHQLEKEQTIVFNVVGTYNYNDYKRLYQETREDVLLTDVNNGVIGKRYSLIGEGIYEKKLGVNVINGGLRHTQSLSDNAYLTGTSEMGQTETYLYGEFKGKVQKLDYTLGIGGTRSSFRQQGEADHVDYTFNPRVVLQLALPGESSIRLKSDVLNTPPNLSDLNAIDQEIDAWQIQRGNPALKPYLGYKTKLTYEVKKSIFYGSLEGTYQFDNHPIMNEKYQEGSTIIKTSDNQKDWQWMSAELYLRIGPIIDIFQISGTVTANHFISHGNTYSHSYTDYPNNVDVSASYKGFSAVVSLYNGQNWLEGEDMYGGEKNVMMFMAGYKYKDLSFKVGVFNPFTNNYKQDSENWSRYASYKKSSYINETSQMYILQFSYDFSFGRTFNSGEKRLNNADEASGVMKSGK
ncbi:TonB-dependent receptor [Bacteroidia bacterium]|nr:TonB-dependent receptor [Bacteroidia bacterium]